MPSYPVVIFLLVSVVTAGSETERASEFLAAAIARYANASTYLIKGTRDTNATDEVQRRWEQETFTLARASSTRYRYDIKIPNRWNVLVGDGMTEWEFQPWENKYTRRSIPNTNIDPESPDDVIRYTTERQARFYIQELQRGIDLKTVEFLPPETLTIAGEEVRCYVLHAKFTNVDPEDSRSGITFWIEKPRKLIRRARSTSILSPSVISPLHKTRMIDTITYQVVDLVRDPPAALFTFAVPSGAKRVPRLFLDDRSIDLAGVPAPPLNLKTLDGKDFDTNSLRGRTVLVDFWASWCVPCIQQMRWLAKLIRSSGRQGLMVVGVNWGDEDLNAALDFLHRNNYDWTNLRADSDTSKAWMVNGVPLIAIIDSQGKIVYYHSGYEQPEEIAIINVLRKVNPPLSIDGVPCDLGNAN